MNMHPFLAVAFDQASVYSKTDNISAKSTVNAPYGDAAAALPFNQVVDGIPSGDVMEMRDGNGKVLAHIPADMSQKIRTMAKGRPELKVLTPATHYRRA